MGGAKLNIVRVWRRLCQAFNSCHSSCFVVAYIQASVSGQAQPVNVHVVGLPQGPVIPQEVAKAGKTPRGMHKAPSK